MALEQGDGAQGRDRTTDTAIFSRMLYQLSYLGISVEPRKAAPIEAASRRCPARWSLNLHRSHGQAGRERDSPRRAI